MMMMMTETQIASNFGKQQKKISAPRIVHMHFEKEINGYEIGNKHSFFQYVVVTSWRHIDDPRPTVIGQYHFQVILDTS